jgi:hypothetical protein
MKRWGTVALMLTVLVTGFAFVYSCGGGGGASSSVISDAAVSTAALNQRSPEIATDGSGGAVVAWVDEKDGSFAFKIFSQRINSLSGNGIWSTDGIPVTATIGDQYSPQVVHDGSAGSIYVWTDNLICGNSVYAQKLDIDSGTPQWAMGGVEAISGRISIRLKAVPDGSGGILFTGMTTTCIGGNSSIFAQRLAASSGTPMWSANGVQLCSTPQNPQDPEVAPDGSGGAVVTWYDARNGNNDVYAQKSAASGGTVQWTVNGIAVSATSGEQEYPQIVHDGSGGVIIAWQDSRNGTYDIYAQRIDIATGTPQWSVDGVAVCATSGDQTSPMLVPDGAGGAVITWQDDRNGNDNIYAQRISMSAGSSQWTSGGVPVCTAAMEQRSPRIIADGEGNMIVSWEDFRNGADYDIYAQKIDTVSGSLLWSSGGAGVSVRSGDQTDHRIVANGSGGAIITWVDDRNGNEDIYAQELRSDGTK